MRGEPTPSPLRSGRSLVHGTGYTSVDQPTDLHGVPWGCYHFNQEDLAMAPNQAVEEIPPGVSQVPDPEASAGPWFLADSRSAFP